MSNIIDKLLNEIYSIENIVSLKQRYDELWRLVRERVYKLEKFKNADTGLKTGIFSYNNMFIWNTIDDVVSKRNIYSEFNNNFIKLRKLYKKYIEEIKKINLIDNYKLLKKIKSSIVRTETLVNILYFYGWNIDRIRNENGQGEWFSNIVSVYYKLDEENLIFNLKKLDKIKNFNTNKINTITTNIIKEFKKIKNNCIIYQQN